MPNNVEWRDSCVTGDTMRWLVAPTAPRSNLNGRGGRPGAQFNAMWGKVSVSAEGDKVWGQAWRVALAGNPGRNGNAMSFAESGTQHVTLIMTLDGKLAAYRGSNSGTLLATSTTQLFFLGDYPHVEAKVKVHDTLGTIEARVNESPVVWDSSVTNIDTRNGGTGVINELWAGTILDNWHMCDFVAQKSGADWHGDRAVIYLPAASAGTYANGTANGAATKLDCVKQGTNADGGHDGDTTYVALPGTAVPETATFGVAALPGNVTAVHDVFPVSLCRKDDPGTDLVRGIFIAGATEDDGGADVASISSYVNIFGVGAGARHYPVDPATGVAWTIAHINTAGYVQVGPRRVA